MPAFGAVSDCNVRVSGKNKAKNSLHLDSSVSIILPHLLYHFALVYFFSLIHLKISCVHYGSLPLNPSVTVLYIYCFIVRFVKV